MATVSATAATLPPPPDKPDALYEFIAGQWQETPPRGAFASLLASVLDRRIGSFAEHHRLGLSMTETLFLLAPQGPARRPDVAFVRYERWPYSAGLSNDPPAFEVVPNIAVEVNSPSNTVIEIFDKVRDYFFAGVEIVWVIVPSHRQVFVYDAPDQLRLLTDKQELDGGSVLPGFRLPLADLFNAAVRPPVQVT